MKRALVISGGGSKGAFAIGVIKRLLSEYPTLHFDMFVGTSTGSLIVPLFASNEIDLLETIYTTQTTQNIVLEGKLGDRLNSNSIFDSSPLWALLTKYYTDSKYEKILQIGKDIYLTTVCLQTGGIVVFTTNKTPAKPTTYSIETLSNANQFRKAIMASASQPVFMPPIKINKDIPGEPHPNYQYVDGGVREYAGVQMAIDHGATEIFTILLAPDTKNFDEKEYTNLFGLLEKTIDIFTDDVGKNDLIIPNLYDRSLEYIQAVKTKIISSGINAATVNDFFNVGETDNPFRNKLPIKLFTIRPNENLGGGPGGLTFDPNEMKGMVQKGETSAENFIASINSLDNTWS